MEQGRLERILDPGFLDGMESWDTPHLRAERAACETEEEAVSYARRVLQGRLDILRAELLRRREAGSQQAADLLGALPAILAADHDQGKRGEAHVRATWLRVPAEASRYEARIDEIADVPTLSQIRELDIGRMEALIEALAAYEHELSATRQALFERVDALRDELADRYRDGRATVRDLLGAPGD